MMRMKKRKLLRFMQESEYENLVQTGEDLQREVRLAIGMAGNTSYTEIEIKNCILTEMQFWKR